MLKRAVRYLLIFWVAVFFTVVVPAAGRPHRAGPPAARAGHAAFHTFSDPWQQAAGSAPSVDWYDPKR